jgi:hypothetical protein
MIYRGQGFLTVSMIWLLPCIQAGEYLMSYRGQGFLTVYDLDLSLHTGERVFTDL